MVSGYHNAPFIPKMRRHSLRFVNAPRTHDAKRPPQPNAEHIVPDTIKSAVVYYSLTGHSKQVAHRLATALGGTLIALNAPR
jgi:hypothetical protein